MCGEPTMCGGGRLSPLLDAGLVAPPGDSGLKVLCGGSVMLSGGAAARWLGVREPAESCRPYPGDRGEGRPGSPQLGDVAPRCPSAPAGRWKAPLVAVCGLWKELRLGVCGRGSVPLTDPSGRGKPPGARGWGNTWFWRPGKLPSGVGGMWKPLPGEYGPGEGPVEERARLPTATVRPRCRLPFDVTLGKGESDSMESPRCSCLIGWGLGGSDRLTPPFMMGVGGVGELEGSRHGPGDSLPLAAHRTLPGFLAGSVRGWLTPTTPGGCGGNVCPARAPPLAFRLT